MKADSKLTRLVMVSPWFLLVFLIIPLFVILNVKFHIRLPLVGVKPLLGNNICFALLVALRFLRYLFSLRKEIRYGSASGKPRQEVSLSRPVTEVTRTLSSAGFSFDATGSYGEKRDPGYLGTTLLYGGLFVLLFFGTYDNLQQFSGTLLDSMGPATKLNRVESYPILRTGPLTGRPDSLPQMKILNLFFPDKKYPKGAVEMVLMSADGKESSKIVTPEDPFAYGDYDIYLARLIFEPAITMKTRDLQPFFSQEVKLNPLVHKVGEFSFFGPFSAAGMDGEAYYQPEKKRLRVSLSGQGKPVFDAVMTFQLDQQVAQGGYILTCDKMGQWAEIHVLRRRHMTLLVIGAVIAALGLLMRILFRPQRVWLAEAEGGGCRVSTAGKETSRAMERLA